MKPGPRCPGSGTVPTLQSRGETGGSTGGIAPGALRIAPPPWCGAERRSGATLETFLSGGPILAKQQGLAALERAGGESAGLRNLTNAAELLERHPGIAQLRLLQAVEGRSGNRIVVPLDPERAARATLDVRTEGEA